MELDLHLYILHITWHIAHANVEPVPDHSFAIARKQGQTAARGVKGNACQWLGSLVVEKSSFFTTHKSFCCFAFWISRCLLAPWKWKGTVQKHRHDMFKEPHVFWRANRTSSLVGPCPCNAVEQTNWFTMVYLYKDTPNDQSTKGTCVPTTTLQWNAMSSLIGPIR